METSQHKEPRQIPLKFLRAIVFCVVCIALNGAGNQSAMALDLPVYLDSLGTILAAMLGGFVPGIAVGYVTNLLNGIWDNAAIYYGIINVLIAVVTAHLAQRGWFKRLTSTLLAIVLLSLVSGSLSLILAYFLNGGNLSNEISAPFAQHLVALGAFDLPMAEVLASMFTNFIDKALVVLTAALTCQILPDSFRAAIDFVPWRQKPLSAKELADTMSERPRQASLATKVVILIAIIVTVVGVTTTGFSYMAFHHAVVESETTKAQNIATLMESLVDPDKVEDFVTQGEAAPGYLETDAKLAEMRDSFDNLQYVYVYQIKPDGCHVVFDPDTEELPGSEPGSVVEFDESFSEYLPALLAGEEIEPVISNDTYGWLLTVYRPLRNQIGETVCYVAVDVSMERLIADESTFLVGIIALFAAFFILVCAIVMWMSRYSVIVPVNSISHAANGFMLNDEGIRSESLAPIQALDIHTGDEIENLYEAILAMAQEAVRYIDEAQKHSDTINRMQSNLIMVMADLVESRDKFTGDHVRNTAAYARIIMNQMRREGICADILTNEFISNVYQSAPLHDIGKIAVSDVILNKPGRLTEEEFEIMKSHTIAGQQILESAKGAVSESSYLDEAQRLAAYHHEKWDGTGYPYGLAGEEIPLSARIMAVADVFDALVSKRSYKAGFPIEKAFAIIEEGIGTHFDPQVARAFLHARDKAAAIVEKTKERKRREEEEEARRNEEGTTLSVLPGLPAVPAALVPVVKPEPAPEPAPKADDDPSATEPAPKADDDPSATEPPAPTTDAS